MDEFVPADMEGRGRESRRVKNEMTDAEIEKLADEIRAGKRPKRKAKPRNTLMRDIINAGKVLSRNRGTISDGGSKK